MTREFYMIMELEIKGFVLNAFIHGNSRGD